MSHVAGFSNPVLDAQATFRHVLRAMSRPVLPVGLAALPDGPLGWPGAMAALVLALCDMDTPVWLDPAARSEQAVEFLRFHCGCPLVTRPQDAAFAVVLDRNNLCPLDRFNLGSDERPDTGTTILLAAQLERSAGPAVAVHGPGVSGPLSLPLAWLPDPFVRDWQANAELFPRGLDLILAGQDCLAALPRTLKLEEALPCM